MKPIHRFTPLLIALVVLAACSSAPKAPPTNALVDAARQTIKTFKARQDLPQFASHLKGAYGIAIFPAIYKAGFFVGAEGGNGVMLARGDDGKWGYPAFYVLASGSFGLQIGGQRAEMVLIMRSPGAVEAVIKHQGKLGADAGLAIAHIGTGVEGSVTTNLGADILAFADAKGLYGGISLEGSAMIRRKDYNDQYYGANSDATPTSILISRAHSNPQADALRRALVVK
jgi:lipid-binding SYLF domain-containing protein